MEEEGEGSMPVEHVLGDAGSVGEEEEEAGLLLGLDSEDAVELEEGQMKERTLTEEDEVEKLLAGPSGPQNVAAVLEEARIRKMKRPKEIYLKNFYKILLLIALFYGLPSMQFVLFQYYAAEDTGIYCYINFKCAKPALGFDAFNNIVSNGAYVVLGGFFLIYVRLTRPPRSAKMGLHTDVSLYYSIGLCMMLEGIFSALYHVCPSRINFQFDTTFMILGTAFLFITMFQKRHPTAVPGAPRTFICLALIILTNFLSLITISIEFFWAWVFVLMLGISIPTALQVYYQRKMPMGYLLACRRSRFWPIGAPGRLAMVLLSHLFSVVFLVFAAKSSIEADQTQDFPTFVLAIVVTHTVIYMVYYVLCKIYFRESIPLVVYLFFLLIVAFWGSGLYFFINGPTNKFLTPEKSKELNQPCLVLDYFDAHDLWHFLSAGGLLAIGLAVYTIDNNIRQRPRAELAVF